MVDAAGEVNAKGSYSDFRMKSLTSPLRIEQQPTVTSKQSLQQAEMVEPKVDKQETVFTPALTPSAISPRGLYTGLGLDDFDDSLLLTPSQHTKSQRTPMQHTPPL